MITENDEGESAGADTQARPPQTAPPPALAYDKNNVGTNPPDTKKGLTVLPVSPCFHWSQLRDLNS